MNPVTVANELRDSYVGYLLSSFGFAESAVTFNQRFRELLTNPGRLIAGPFLEKMAPLAERRTQQNDPATTDGEHWTHGEVEGIRSAARFVFDN